ncbi:MAG TPA: protein kinase [Phycisphaerae bacterium]|nr:protein kinase [Phycisphaerae bacterium]HRY70664.1 protein kinase [Phycisphaerae bacterium]HSA28741.1 protein kinase [Phycisphaerae bacterium]
MSGGPSSSGEGPSDYSGLIRFAREQAQAARLREKQGLTPLPPDVSPAECLRELEPALLSDSFPGYQLRREIHRGGQGVVYEAVQRATGRKVALKMILAGEFASEAEVRRFQAEAEAAANLDHPNIVPIYEVGVHQGRCFFCMKLIEGGSLARQMRRLAEDPRAAARLMAQVAHAVHHAHQHGILHRDLKPDNILLDAGGHPYVTDFGLARRVGEDRSLTLTGQLVGTPSYMAPEQAAGSGKQLSVAADTYSLGAILYQLLAGQPPFVADTPLATLQQARDIEPRRPSTINRRINRDLETICLKCLEKDPQQRYASAGALAEELERWLEGRTILARPVGQTAKFWRWCRRKPLVAGMAAALAVVFAAGFLGVLWQWRRAVAGESVARHNERVAQQNELTTRRNAYAADMILVQEALAEGDLGQAQSLLERNRPQPGQEDLRGWEWRYRWQQCRPDPALLGKLLRHDAAPVNCTAISPDGRWLAAGALDGWVGLVDLGSGQIRPIQQGGPRKGVVAFSSDGRLLAFTGQDGQRRAVIKLWDVAGDKEVSIRSPEASVQTMAFSPDSRLLAASTADDAASAADQLVRVWDVQTWDPLTPIPFDTIDGWFEGPIATSPHGNILAVGRADGHVHLVSLPAGERLLDIPAHSERVLALAFSPDGKVLASGAGLSDCSIRLWDTTTGASLGALNGHRRYIHALAFSPKGGTLASASADQSIMLWQVPSGQRLGTLRGHTDEVLAVSFSPDGDRLASSSKDGSIWLWSSVPRCQPDPQVLRDSGIWHYVYVPDGKSFVALKARPSITSSGVVKSMWSGPVSLWDAETMTLKEPLDALGTDNFWLAISPDGRLLAVGGDRASLKVWDLEARRLLTPPTGISVLPDDQTAPGHVWVGFSRDGTRLFTLVKGPNRLIRAVVREVPTWKAIASFPPRPQASWLDFSPDARLQAVGFLDGKVVVWSLGRDQPVAEEDPGGGIFAIKGVSFSPDGSTLAAGGLDGSLFLWDVRTWRALGPPPREHMSGTHFVAFFPDGRRVASFGGNQDEAAIIRDLATRRRVATLHGEGTAFEYAVFSPDGNTIMAKSIETHINIWQAPSWAEIEAIEAAEREQAQARK